MPRGPHYMGLPSWRPGMFFFLSYTNTVYILLYSIYILLAASFTGYAGALPAYPVAPPLVTLQAMDKTSAHWSCSSVGPAPPSIRCTWKRTTYSHPWRLWRWRWPRLTRRGLRRRQRLPVITATVAFESTSHSIVPLTFLFFFQSSSHPRTVGHGAPEGGATSSRRGDCQP